MHALGSSTFNTNAAMSSKNANSNSNAATPMVALAVQTFTNQLIRRQIRTARRPSLFPDDLSCGSSYKNNRRPTYMQKKFSIFGGRVFRRVFLSF